MKERKDSFFITEMTNVISMISNLESECRSEPLFTAEEEEHAAGDGGHEA